MTLAFKTRARTAILGVALLFGAGDAAAQLAGEVSSSELYRRQFFVILDRLNSGLKAKGIPVVEVDQTRVRVVRIDDLWPPEAVKVHCNPVFNVDFALLSEKWKTPYAISVYRDIPLSWLGSYDKPPKPTWDTNRAVRECSSWYEFIFGEPLANVSAPQTEYEEQPNLPKYRSGQWSIRWPRTDSKGRQFLRDNVYCTLDEKFGIRYLSRSFVSTFNETQPVTIGSEEAIVVARATAEKLLRMRITSKWSHGFRLETGGDAEALIVNPNHILKYKDPDEVPLGDLNARLAWCVKCVARDKEGNRVEMYIWVDTETKEILGADFRSQQP